MTCRPASQFCCGFSVETGVKIILVYNLLQNLWFVFQAIGHMILKSITFGFMQDRVVECAITALCLAGIPLIVVAFLSVPRHIEAPIRAYFFYMILVIIIDLCFFVKRFLLAPQCDDLPQALEMHGRAFACGLIRGGDITAVVSAISIQAYFVHVVWSFCEDLRLGGAASTGMADLTYSKEAVLKRDIRDQEDYYNKGVIKLQSEWGHAHDFLGQYGTVEEWQQGIGGSQRILGGTFHDLNYPPRAI